MFWNTARKAFVLGLLLTDCGPVGAIAQGNSRDAVSPEFRAWVDARAGTGQPVHWVAEGGVYEYPSGRKLFGMVGFDSSRVIWPGRPGDPVIPPDPQNLCLYRSADRRGFQDRRSASYTNRLPVPDDYLSSGRRADFSDVEQGTGRAVQTIKARDGIRYRWIGPIHWLSRPLFSSIFRCPAAHAMKRGKTMISLFTKAARLLNPIR